MKRRINTLTIYLTIVMFCSSLPAAHAQQKDIRILLVTGGHGFKKVPFYNMFDSLQGIRYDTIVQPAANELINSPAVDQYEVLVFYDMPDSITPAQQQAYTRLLNQGKAMVFLHHALVSYQRWPEFTNIIGGKYHTVPVTVNGVTYRSNYKHDVVIPVKVENRQHPVTKGINDFEIFDEVYGDCEIRSSIKPLLSTTHPKSMRYLAWTHHYGRSEVLFIQLGHGPEAFRDPHYRQLLQQGIHWSAQQHTRKK